MESIIQFINNLDIPFYEPVNTLGMFAMELLILIIIAVFFSECLSHLRHYYD